MIFRICAIGHETHLLLCISAKCTVLSGLSGFCFTPHTYSTIYVSTVYTFMYILHHLHFALDGLANNFILFLYNDDEEF